MVTRYIDNTVEQLAHWREVNFGRELSDGWAAAVSETARGMDRALDEMNEPQNTCMTRITGLPEFLADTCQVCGHT